LSVGSVFAFACPLVGEGNKPNLIFWRRKMIYTKNKNKKNPVLDGNTFSVCCKCGKEVPVPLNELFKAKKEHPLSARIVCPECTKKRFKQYHPTINDVVALALSLCKLGFTRQVRSTYDNYDIKDIQELHPEAYGNFVNGLLTAVAGGENT
jgi:hypothetical protein